MAEVKVSALPISTTLSANDRVVILTNPSGTAVVKTITAANFVSQANVVINYANTTSAGIIKVGNNLTINATGFLSATSSGSGNADLAYTNAVAYADTKAATAYSNAVADAAALYQTSAGLNANVATYLSDGNDKVITGSNITLNGNVAVNGNTNFFASNNTIYSDALVELHAPGGDIANTWMFNDGKDIGHRFHYYDGGDKNAALVFANDTRNLEFYVDGTESAGVFAGTYGNVKANNFYGTASSANNSTNFGGLSLANVQSQITGNSATAYANAVANAAALYQTTAGLSANIASNLASFGSNPITTTGTVTIGSLVTNGILIPAALTTNTNDWNPAGLSSCMFLRASATTNVSLTGIQAPNPASNLVIFLLNLGSGNINILRNNAGSSVGNRFINNNDVLLNTNECVIMMYDSTSLGWRIFGIQN